MEARELGIKGCWEISTKRHLDERGTFSEIFVDSKFEDLIGVTLQTKQVNQSTSLRGVLRGLHWADVPPGQAKYVFCPRGRVLDLVVDLRTSSQTFLKWEVVELSPSSANAVYISNGVGHGFLSLEDDTVVTYLCSESYSPKTERTLNLFDEEIGLPWEMFCEQFKIDKLIMSERDRNAPSVQHYLSREEASFPISG